MKPIPSLKPAHAAVRAYYDALAALAAHGAGHGGATETAFSRLVTAMEACCKASEGKESLERWLAEGFWFVSSFVRDWTGHPSFPRPEPEEYYEKAIARLSELAYWFFRGESPYLEGHQSNPL